MAEINRRTFVGALRRGGSPHSDYLRRCMRRHNASARFAARFPADLAQRGLRIEAQLPGLPGATPDALGLTGVVSMTLRARQHRGTYPAGNLFLSLAQAQGAGQELFGRDADQRDPVRRCDANSQFDSCRSTNIFSASCSRRRGLLVHRLPGRQSVPRLRSAASDWCSNVDKLAGDGEGVGIDWTQLHNLNGPWFGAAATGFPTRTRAAGSHGVEASSPRGSSRLRSARVDAREHPMRRAYVIAAAAAALPAALVFRASFSAGTVDVLNATVLDATTPRTQVTFTIQGPPGFCTLTSPEIVLGAGLATFAFTPLIAGTYQETASRRVAQDLLTRAELT